MEIETTDQMVKQSDVFLFIIGVHIIFRDIKILGIQIKQGNIL